LPESTGRREQILQAAQKLFADKGFREANLNDVAVQLGFRRQAVYHHFPSKDEILYELIDRAGQSIATSEQEILDADIPPEAKLAEVVRNHVRQLVTNLDIFRIQFSELFKLTTEAGQRDNMTQALLILGMCNGVTEWYSADRSPLGVDEIADYAARMALAGATGANRRKR
jgi:AcrR family transcriptional regulator